MAMKIVRIKTKEQENNTFKKNMNHENKLQPKARGNEIHSIASATIQGKRLDYAGVD
jgi:hypothetical protein